MLLEGEHKGRENLENLLWDRGGRGEWEVRGEEKERKVAATITG